MQLGLGIDRRLQRIYFSIAENLKEQNIWRLIREAGALAEYYIGLVRLKEWLELKGVNFTRGALEAGQLQYELTPT